MSDRVPGSTPSSPVFTMLGAPDALACESDACVIPGSESTLDIEPSADEAAAASRRAVTAALDEGASL